MPSRIKHDSYGVYDKLEERFVISAVVADTPTEAYDIAWRLKDKQDQLHEEEVLYSEVE